MTKSFRNIILTVAYDGSSFSGFQFQPNVVTIQGEIERAIKVITKKTTRIHGSGRTDAGVHAVEQVVLMKTESLIPVDKLIIGLNSALPGSIRILSAKEGDSNFHPRFSAKSKHYRYLFHLVKYKSPFLERFFFQIETRPDIELMKLASAEFMGTHDFYSFVKSPEHYETTVRRILYSEISFDKDIITFDIIGTGFMHNMVRNMAKALYLVGNKKLSLDKLVELYRNHNRQILGAPAPPGGLYMMKVMY